MEYTKQVSLRLKAYIIGNLIIMIGIGIASPLSIKLLAENFSQEEISWLMIGGGIFLVFQFTMNKIKNKKISLWLPIVIDFVIIYPVVIGLLYTNNIKTYLIIAQVIMGGGLMVLYNNSGYTFREIYKKNFSLSVFENRLASANQIGLVVGYFINIFIGDFSPVVIYGLTNTLVFIGICFIIYAYKD